MTFRLLRFVNLFPHRFVDSLPHREANIFFQDDSALIRVLKVARARKRQKDISAGLLGPRKMVERLSLGR